MSTECTACQGNKYLLGTSCVTDCGELYYANYKTHKCLSCGSGCQTCFGPYNTNCYSMKPILIMFIVAIIIKFILRKRNVYIYIWISLHKKKT